MAKGPKHYASRFLYFSPTLSQFALQALADCGKLEVKFKAEAASAPL